MKRRTFLAGVGATGLSAIGSPAIVRAAADTPLKFGVLSDMSGLFADNGGQGSVAAAQLAIDECGGKVLGKTIELIQADHLN
ncbi:MAG: transporter permease [Daejeonella sp.]|nr:transporter permease [Daejeonella sp.]